MVPDVDLLTRFGQNVRAARTARGLTQRQLGAAVGLARASIANVEAGRQDPPLTKLAGFAQALGVEVAALLGTEAGPSLWLDLARRVTADERLHRQRSDDCWRNHDVTAAVRLRGIADGLVLARDHQLAVCAAAQGEGS